MKTIKAPTPFQMIGGGIRRFGRLMKKAATFPDEGKLNQEQDRKNRSNAPVGAVGGTNKGEYKGSK